MSIGLTIRQLAQRLAEPEHRVRYAVESRNIQPAARAGAVRLFSENQVPAIRAAIDSLANRMRTRDATSPVPEELRP